MLISDFSFSKVIVFALPNSPPQPPLISGHPRIRPRIKRTKTLHAFKIAWLNTAIGGNKENHIMIGISKWYLNT